MSSSSGYLHGTASRVIGNRPAESDRSLPHAFGTTEPVRCQDVPQRRCRFPNPRRCPCSSHQRRLRCGLPRTATREEPNGAARNPLPSLRTMTAQPHDEGIEVASTESGWILVDADHYLSADPSDDEIASPLPDPAPSSFNFQELSWKNFERLSCRIARSVEGAYEIRTYGKGGQDQYGIDFVGFFEGKSPTVYQAKRRQTLSTSDLNEVVKKYADSQRPFNADRLVIMVSCDAHDAKIVERLDSLRTIYSDLKIDLWGREELTERLISHPNIVRRFFGVVTCDRLCGTNYTTIDKQDSSIASDAIIRGPILQMGLSSDYEQAKSILETDPLEAATILEGIAEEIGNTPFAAYAVQLRREQASALEAAGQIERSFRIRLDTAWQLVDSTDLWTAIVILRQIDSSEVALPDDLDRSARALAAVVQLRSEHTGSLDELAARFDQMREGDLHRHTAAIALVEECIAARRTDIVRSRITTLNRLAETQPSDKTSQMVTARILMSIADATGDWEQLAITARERYAPPITSLILARNARYNALASKLKISMSRYLDAIARSTDEQMYGDAISWLYALRTVRSYSSSFTGDINDSHRLAQATETQGIERVLAANNARAHAMRTLLNKKWPDALEASRRYLWHSVTTASWTEEFEANELIGDVFAATGRPLDAARHYIRAGHRKKAEKLGARLAEESLDLSIDMLGDPYWERAAAYKLVAQGGDLLTETSATAWVCAALNDTIANITDLYSRNMFGANAFEAFSALSDAASEEDADRFIQFAAQLVSRRPDSYQITDEYHIRALMGIAKKNIELRKAALRQALELLLVTKRPVWDAFFEEEELIQLEVPLVEELLKDPAASGNEMACLGLIFAGANTSPVSAYARQRLAAVTAERVHEPGVQHIGTNLTTDAALVSVLDLIKRETFVREMMARASDKQEPSMNRGEALLAATQLIDDLEPATKSEIFEITIGFAQGEYDHGVTNPFEISNDPLSRFRINIGLHSLRPMGLRCAACCAITAEQIDKVRDLAIDLLSSGDHKVSSYVAEALLELPSGLTAETVELLSTYRDEWIRAVAAVEWGKSIELELSTGQRLAKDPSALVRRSLAMALQDRPEHLPVREVLQNDPRRSIRSIVRPN